MKTKYQFYCLINIFFIFVSCAFLSIDDMDSMRVKKSTVINAKDYPENNTSVIIGSLNLKDIKEQPIVILACSANPVTKEKKYIISYIIINHTTKFMLYLPEGDYFLYAITDLNNDYIFDDGEITGVFGKPDKVTLRNNEIKNNINIAVGSSLVKGIKLSEKFYVQYNYNTVEYTTYNGQFRKIYSEIFSPDNAKIGWWHPSLFMKAFGANIYLIEEYNPAKIPVLFVHGAQGSPQDWAYFYVRLDKKKYQPLFFYYPAGLRLPLLSQLLYIKIKDLKKKYNFKKLYLIAHSMGGLVTRSMLTNYYGKKENFIKLYVTLATPWSGFEFADAALKTAPYVLPSWIDVSSHSMFIKTILDKNISHSIDYYLFYGKNDETSKGRALDARAYSGAKGVFGFNADHNTILSEKEVFKKFNEILSN